MRLAHCPLTRASGWAAYTPRFYPGLPSRFEVHSLLILEKAAAFEHQLKTTGKLTDG